MIKTIAIIAIVALGVLLAFAASRPDTFRVERTASIKAPPERLHGLINDMRQLNTWNPFASNDAVAKGQYRGPQAGPGATFDFEGGKSGKGSISIVDSAPGRVTMKLDMLEPMEGHNTIEFTIAPRGEATDVTWVIHGPSNFISKLVSVFMDMDKMVGGKFEAGLADLKARAEG